MERQGIKPIPRQEKISLTTSHHHHTTTLWTNLKANLRLTKSMPSAVSSATVTVSMTIWKTGSPRQSSIVLRSTRATTCQIFTEAGGIFPTWVKKWSQIYMMPTSQTYSPSILASHSFFSPNILADRHTCK